jgi:aminopeptidase N
MEEYAHQYKYAGGYVDRREAIDFASKNQADPGAVELLTTALKDRYQGLRSYTINKLDLKKENVKKAVELLIADLARNEKVRLVKAAAISKLAQYKNPAYTVIFKTAIQDSSYTVSGNALKALLESDSEAALMEAKRLADQPSKGALSNAITTVMIASGEESSADMILERFRKMSLSQNKFNLMQSIGDFVVKIKNADVVRKAVDEIASFRDGIPEAYKSQTNAYINGLLKTLVNKKQEAGLKDQAEYIKSKLPEEEKKGF